MIWNTTNSYNFHVLWCLRHKIIKKNWKNGIDFFRDLQIENSSDFDCIYARICFLKEKTHGFLTSFFCFRILYLYLKKIQKRKKLRRFCKTNIYTYIYFNFTNRKNNCLSAKSPTRRIEIRQNFRVFSICKIVTIIYHWLSIIHKVLHWCTLASVLLLWVKQC